MRRDGRGAAPPPLASLPDPEPGGRFGIGVTFPDGIPPERRALTSCGAAETRRPTSARARIQRCAHRLSPPAAPPRSAPLLSSSSGCCCCCCFGRAAQRGSASASLPLCPHRSALQSVSQSVSPPTSPGTGSECGWAERETAVSACVCACEGERKPTGGWRHVL